MNKESAFYYSRKQSEISGTTFALINGVKVEYSEAMRVTNHKSNWDDAIFLGIGQYAGSKG